MKDWFGHASSPASPPPSVGLLCLITSCGSHCLVDRKEKEAQTSRADVSYEKLRMLTLRAVSLDAGAQAGPSGQPYSGGGFGAPQQGSFGAAPGGFGQPSPPAFGGSQF